MSEDPQRRDFASPDWDKVPFDVNCARCGHDLEGQTEPKCAKCGLEFEWTEAVPLEELTCLKCGYHLYGLAEQRCPECWEPFVWEEVLKAYHYRRQPLFEYHWRDAPVSSFRRTWLLALRPLKLWSQLDIHDPPQIRGLLGLSAVAIVFFAISLPIFRGLLDWGVSLESYITIPRLRAPLIRLGALNPLHGILPFFSAPQTYVTFLLTLCWCLCSFVSLMIFQQSMRRYRVNTGHVLRVWAMAVPLTLVSVVPVASILFFVCSALKMSLSDLFRRSPTIIWLLVGGFVLFHAAWSIRCGYSRYLRMRRAWVLALGSQIVAVLAALWLAETLMPGMVLLSLARAADRANIWTFLP